MPNTMGHIKRSIVLVIFTQLLSYGEPKTIVFNSYSSEPARTVSQPQNATDQQHQIVGALQQEASESSGRGFSTGSGGGGGGGARFPFSIHPDFLSKPVPVPRPNVGYKSPKYIVYPSYSKNSPNTVPYYNAPVAMDRFAPGEAYGGTIYKLKKQKQSIQPGNSGAPFASIPAASFNSPVSVPLTAGLRPAASHNSPVSVLAPSGPSAGPPAGPPMPPGMQPDQPPVFMPTPVPNSGEDTSHTTEPPNTSSTLDSSEIILFPPNSHAGYLPPTDKGQSEKRPSSPDVYKPSNDLFKFPPNTNATYSAPPSERSKNPVTSYLPPPSGDITVLPAGNAQSVPAESYKGSVELFKFPPNVDAGYLPPGDMQDGSSEHTGTSYGAPPSGDPSSPANLKPITNINPGLEPNQLHRFSPNTLSNYLPPDVPMSSMQSGTSYIPPPSGDPKAPVNLKPTPSKPFSHQHFGTGDSYMFPPNIHSDYLPPVGKEQASVTSYLPPPSGNPNSPANLTPFKTHSYMAPADFYKFPPNVLSQYLPPSNNPPRQNNAVTSYLPPASGIPGDDAVGTISVGPGKPQYLPPSYSENRPPMQKAPDAPMMSSMAMMHPMTAPSMDGPPTGPSGMDADPEHHHHDLDHYHGHEHYHDHHPHHEHDFPTFSGFDHDHYPDIIYDHDHHHHDDHTTMPPPPPPPPAPETPRLKNYSYYYLSRTLWYVPLYFTLYFTFYVAILIIRSIARHKVNLPNQWVGNTRSFGSIRDLNNKEAQQKATMMAVFAMKQIEDFREKYL